MAVRTTPGVTPSTFCAERNAGVTRSATLPCVSATVNDCDGTVNPLLSRSFAITVYVKGTESPATVPLVADCSAPSKLSVSESSVPFVATSSSNSSASPITSPGA